MCQRTTCSVCEKPSWNGCGAHVEQVLADVAVQDRCSCATNTRPSAPPARAVVALAPERTIPARFFLAAGLVSFLAAAVFTVPILIEFDSNSLVVFWNTSGRSSVVGSWIVVAIAAGALSPISFLALRQATGRNRILGWLFVAPVVPMLIGIVISEEQPFGQGATLVLLMPMFAVVLLSRWKSPITPWVVLAMAVAHVALLVPILAGARDCSSAEDCLRMPLWMSCVALGMYWIGCGFGLELVKQEEDRR